MIVSETDIDQILNASPSLENSIHPFLEKLGEDQAAFLVYLQEEYFPVLTKKETEYLIFMLFIIIQALQEKGVLIEEFSIDRYQQFEETNWEKLSNQKSGKFREKLDVFFENYEEEDLLAFVEDMLTIEDDDDITPVGRGPIFIICKSSIDYWLRSSE